MNKGDFKRTAKVKFKQDKGFEPYIEGNYEFKISNEFTYSDNFVPMKDVSFGWSIEIMQDISTLQKEEEAFEMLAEQLKNDFLVFLKNYPGQNK